MLDKITGVITGNPKTVLVLIIVLIIIIVYGIITYHGIFGLGPYIAGGTEIKTLVAKINKARKSGQ